VRTRLAQEVERLRRVAGHVSWVAPDNFHVTLKFLGRVETVRLPAVTAALAEAAAGCSPFDLALRDLGAFPARAHPRVVWAGIDEGAGAASRLARRVDEALVGIGFERETRPFSAHVTLGRVRERRATPRLATALSGVSYGRQRIDHLSLMRSDLSPGGSRYTELAAVPLTGGASAAQ
jgi:2'-5' RNA ligase